LIRDSYPFTGIDPVPYSSRVRDQGLSAQFRMILTRKHSSAQAHKLLDKESYIWDNMITINKRITHDNSKRIRRKIYRAWQQVQSFGSEAQEPARLRLWDDPAAARAGRPIRRGAGMHHGWPQVPSFGIYMQLLQALMGAKPPVVGGETDVTIAIKEQKYTDRKKKFKVLD
jgi:hypothetical protein